MNEDKCPLCGNKEGRVIFRSGKYSIRKCAGCTFMYTLPFPGSETLRMIYEGLYKPQQENDLYKPDFLKGYYREGIEAFQEILRYIVTKKTRGKLLEVGCNYGLFLQEAHRAGFEVCGVDIVNPMVRYVREVLGLAVVQGRFEEVTFNCEEFDVVVMLDSLEHVEGLLTCAEKAYRILKKDGILVVTVPNTPVYLFKSRLISLLPFWNYEKSGKEYIPGVPYNEMDLPLHLNHFTKKTLGSLLKKVGFGKLDFFLSPEKFPYGHTARINLRKKYIAFSKKLFALTRINIHSKLLVIAVK